MRNLNASTTNHELPFSDAVFCVKLWSSWLLPGKTRSACSASCIPVQRLVMLTFSRSFPDAMLHTTDIRQCERVDIVWDLEQDPPAQCLGAYDLLISTSVLEHVQTPLAGCCQQMERVLKPGGCLYMSVPWVWEFHAFPSDYWRFSLPALDVLFNGSSSIVAAWSTYPDGALYRYSPGFDQQLMASQESTTPEGGASRRRLLPLLLLHNLRRKP